MNLSARLRKHLPERNVSEGGHAESTPPFTPGLLSVRCSRLALREPRFSHTLYCAEEREREKNSERRFSGSETNRQAHDSAYALKTHTCQVAGILGNFSFSSFFPGLPNKPQSIHMYITLLSYRSYWSSNGSRDFLFACISADRALLNTSTLEEQSRAGKISGFTKRKQFE